MDDMELRQNSTSTSPNSLQGNAVALKAPTDDKSICYTKTPVYQAMRALLYLCTAGGLVFTKKFAATGMKMRVNASQVYSFLLMMFLTTNVARCYTMIKGNETFGVLLFLKMTYCVWSLETLGHYVASLISCLYYKRLPEYFIEWEKIRPDCTLTLNEIKRYATISATILGILLVTNSIFTTYLVFWTNTLDSYLAPWDRGFGYVFVIQVINAIQQFYCTFVWFGPSVLMYIVCKILAHEFHAIQHRIRRITQEQTVPSEDTLERLRRHHQNLCNLVANADDIFSMQIAFSFAGSLVIACFLQYIIVYDDGPNSTKPLIVFIKAFWVAICFTKVSLDCVSGTILNSAVSNLRNVKTGEKIIQNDMKLFCV